MPRFRVHQYIFILIPICCFACGTLGGSNQIVSIDSQHRGEAVYNEQQDLLGHTPLFIKLHPKSTHTLYTKSPTGFKEHLYHCQARWGQAGLENLPLSLLFLPSLYLNPSILVVGATVGSVGIGSAIDVGSGAAFRCPKRIIVNNTGKRKAFRSRCGIQVPESLNDEQRTQLIYTWMQTKVAQSLCTSLIPLNTMRSELRILGLSDHINHITRSDQEAIFRFAYRTHTDYLIFINQHRFDHLLKQQTPPKMSRQSKPTLNQSSSQSHLNIDTSYSATHTKKTLRQLFKKASKDHMKKDSQDIRLRYKVLDLHALQFTKISTVKLTVNKSVKKAFENESLATFIRHWFYLFPDAIHVGRSSLQLDNQFDQGRTAGASFSLTSVSHPDAFARWDYQIGLTPEVIADIFNNQLNLGIWRNMNTPRQITFRRLGGLVFANLIIHTPIGAISAGPIGGGMVFLNKKNTDYSWLYGVQGSYTVFIGRRIFTRLEVNRHFINMKLENLNFNSGLSAIFSVGVHIPEVASWIRSSF